MLKRRYKIMLECEVEVRELTPERLRFDHIEGKRQDAEAGPFDDPPPALPAPENLNDQRILQEALLASPEALEAFVRGEIAAQLEAEGLEGCERPDNWQELLIPVVESLPPRQRHRFREAIARGVFIEDAEELFDSVRVELGRIWIELAE